MTKSEKDALVVVFGSISQSPRMLNHVQSLKESGYTVSLIGYGNKKSVVDNVTFLEIPEFSLLKPTHYSLPIVTVFRMIYTSIIHTLIFLWLGLFKVGKPDIIIVQVNFTA
jgi:hypothetical protein